MVNISVIIPLYNKAFTIGHTIECVLGQTYKNFEVIIVDDGSKDNGVNIVSAFTDPRIKLIRQENGGVSCARNTGILNAKYDFVSFLDADDEWKSDYLENVAQLIEKYPQCAVFSMGYIMRMEDLNIESTFKGTGFEGESGIIINYFKAACMSKDPLISSSSVTVLKEALIAVGMFPIGVPCGEDIITWAKLAYRYPVALSKRKLASYVMRPDILLTGQPVRFYDNTEYVEECLKDMLQDRTYPYRSDIRKYLALWYKMQMSTYMRAFRLKTSVANGLKSLKYNPLEIKIYLMLLISLLPNNLQKKLFMIYFNSKYRM
jgi:glycosyltransferase involved in cell wall biosynthesis